jgi:formiminotetrahydrofolate cyclodeaminase
MVANLTIGKQRYAAVQDEMKEARGEAERLRRALTGLMRRDSQAFERVLAAVRRPQGTPAEAEERARSLVEATWEATRVPLETAETCAEVAQWAARMVTRGNANAASDGATAAALAQCAAYAALCNVQINLKNLPDGADKETVRTRVQELARRADEALAEAKKAFADATERTA